MPRERHDETAVPSPCGSRGRSPGRCTYPAAIAAVYKHSRRRLNLVTGSPVGYRQKPKSTIYQADRVVDRPNRPRSCSASKARRGPKKAAIAVAASLLTAAYHMLKNGTFHQDLGADFLVQHDKARIATKLANRIKDLGYDVCLTPVA